MKMFKWIILVCLSLNVGACAVTKPYSQGDSGRDMVLVPAGEFMMGTNEEEIPYLAKLYDERAKWFKREVPKHKVYVDAFYIDKYEVTNSDFEKFIKAGGYNNKEYWTDEGWEWKEIESVVKPAFWGNSNYNKPDQPVVGISWYEAYAYAKWRGGRLPTEAEWEKAARGTDGRLYPWGEAPADEGGVYRANYKSAKRYDEDGFYHPAPVGSFPKGASPYGCQDMAGNVWEWCSDWFGFEYYRQSPGKNPKGPPTAPGRVVRGGSWRYLMVDLRCTFRFAVFPDVRLNFGGFRCVKGLNS